MFESRTISVITPVFNAGNYLQAAWESLLAQTYNDWEWLVIDDGSSDGCTSFLEKIADQRVKLIRQDNRGVSAARNQGLRRMSGRFYCFLDADDILPPNSLASRLEVLDNNPQAHFADGATEKFDDEFPGKESTWVPSFKGDPTERLLAIDGKCFFGNTWLVRREVNFDYRFKEGMTHSEDLLFYLSICRGKELDFTTETVLRYRQTHGSAMRDLSGLELGYRLLVAELTSLGYSTEDQSITRRKARSITCRSWLKAGKPVSAVKSLLKPWK